MPIRHGGRLASRASTWPRDHFCRSTIAPRRSYDVERVLADIDADHRDCAVGLLRHGVLLVFADPGQILLLAGQAGARPGARMTRQSHLSSSSSFFASLR